MEKKQDEKQLIDDEDELEEDEDELEDDDDSEENGDTSEIVTEESVDDSPIEKMEWDDALSVDIPEIDALQKNVFALLNELIDCKESGCSAKDSATIVVKLIDESRLFFSKEEESLRRCGYPESDAHAKEHRQFIKSVINIRRQVSEDDNNLTYGVIKSLREWLLAHIVRFDLMYVPFVRVNRYIDEARQKR